MIQYIIILALVTSIYFYYNFVYKPKQLYKFYSNTLETLGYKVLKLPFQPFEIAFIKRYRQSFQQHKDSFYFDKHIDQKYDFVIHNIMNQITLDLVNPDFIRQFLSMDKIFIFPKRKIYVANLKRLLGNGVTFSQQQIWKTKRKIITSVFNFDFLKSIIPTISMICDEQLQKSQDQWKSQNINSDQVKVHILQTAFNIFSNVLMVSFFGMDSNKYKIEGKTPCQFITEALLLANSQATEPLGYLFGPWIFNLGITKRDRRVNHCIKIFRKFGANLIKQKIQFIKADKKQNKGKNHTDLIEALAYFYILGNQNQNSHQKYSIDDVIDQFCTLFAAATDTTSHFFMMIVYYIVETPEVETRLRKQIDEIFPTDDDITYQNLKKIKFIDFIQEEVTRIYGPTSGVFLRQAIKNTEILNVPIIKGTSMSIKPMLNHYNSDYFQEPLEFKPQRWEKHNNLHPYTMLGFSAGPRSCLGKHLALLQTKISLIKLFKRYRTINLQKHRDNWEMKFQFLYTPQKFMTILKH